MQSLLLFSGENQLHSLALSRVLTMANILPDPVHLTFAIPSMSHLYLSISIFNNCSLPPAYKVLTCNFPVDSTSAAGLSFLSRGASANAIAPLQEGISYLSSMTIVLFVYMYCCLSLWRTDVIDKAAIHNPVFGNKFTQAKFAVFL